MEDTRSRSEAETRNAVGLSKGRSQLEPFVFLYITEKCQLRCAHCYVGERLEREAVMAPELAHQILSAMRTLYGHYKVYLLGGEPTTHPELAALLNICKSEDYSVVVTSNGLIPESQWRILQRHLVDELSFSVDGGTAATHERMRGRNTFSPLVRSIERSVREGFYTRLICTVTRDNVHEFDQLVSLAESLGVRTVSLHYFTPTGNGRSRAVRQLSPSEWMDFVEVVRERARSSGVSIFYPPCFCTAADLNGFVERGYRGCTARNLERVAFYPDGRCYICSAFFDTDLHFGEFRDGTLVPLNRESELTLVNRLGPHCGTCPSKARCRGGCGAYDYFERTYPSDACDSKVVPLCPLWSTAAAEASPFARELR